MSVNSFDYKLPNPSLDEVLWGKKPLKSRKSQKQPAKKKEIKRQVYTADFNHLMDKQKGFCANKKCAKFNRIKQRVTTIKDIDHKIPIKLWELMNKKGNPNARSNLQLLCTGCHRRKTAEDRKKIAEYKKAHGIKKTKKSSKKKTTTKRRPTSPFDLSYNPLNYKPPKIKL